MCDPIHQEERTLHVSLKFKSGLYTGCWKLARHKYDKMLLKTLTDEVVKNIMITFEKEDK